MAISDDKKRVAFSLTDEDVKKIKFLYELDKKESDERIYESDTIKKLIDVAYNKRKKGQPNDE